jgi:hypothetical protein
MLRIRDVYPESRILIFIYPGSRIPDFGSNKSNKRGERKKFVFLPYLFVATNITILKLILFLNWREEKNLGQFTKNYRTLPKKLSLSSRDPRSGIRKKPIPDPGVKKAPDPGSATLTVGWPCFLRIKEFFPRDHGPRW